jgi:hypothetical protein
MTSRSGQVCVLRFNFSRSVLLTRIASPTAWQGPKGYLPHNEVPRRPRLDSINKSNPRAFLLIQIRVGGNRRHGVVPGIQGHPRAKPAPRPLGLTMVCFGSQVLSEGSTFAG